MIDESDCVLAIMTGPPGPAVTSELNYAVAKKKTVVPVLQTGIQQSPILDRMPQVFRFSPGNPGKVEAEVVQFLKSQEFDKQNRQAIGALVMVGLGLLVMSALSDK
jgi:nucleoside 2-deoxyribosyltransferase